MKQKTKTAIGEKKPRRTFSPEFKRAKVGEIASKLVSVSGVSEQYDVSRSAIYKWIALYDDRPKSVQTVVQLESEHQKTKLLQERLATVEAALGRKQLEVEFLTTLVEVSSDELGIDLKKTFATRHSTGLQNEEHA